MFRMSFVFEGACVTFSGRLCVVCVCCSVCFPASFLSDYSQFVSRVCFLQFLVLNLGGASSVFSCFAYCVVWDMSDCCGALSHVVCVCFVCVYLPPLLHTGMEDLM